jgi:hypothetical protein
MVGEPPGLEVERRRPADDENDAEEGADEQVEGVLHDPGTEHAEHRGSPNLRPQEADHRHRARLRRQDRIQRDSAPVGAEDRLELRTATRIRRDEDVPPGECVQERLAGVEREREEQEWERDRPDLIEDIPDPAGNASHDVHQLLVSADFTHRIIMTGGHAPAPVIACAGPRVVATTTVRPPG